MRLSWRQKLCRYWFLVFFLIKRRTVKLELVLAETKVKTAVEKVSADGCWRKCSPEPVMGG